MSAKNNIVEYGRDVVTFVTNKIIKNKILIMHQNKCRPQKQPKDVVMFLPNKTIKNKKFNYLAKTNVGQKNNTIWGRCCNAPTSQNKIKIKN